MTEEYSEEHLAAMGWGEPVEPTENKVGGGNTQPPPPPKEGKDNQCTNWFFTLNNPSEGAIEPLLALCKKYIYQLEEGENKTPHFQGVIILNKKLRFKTIKEKFPKFHWERTRAVNKAVDYCSKNESRIGGPWAKGFRLPTGDPMQTKTARRWQQEVLDILKTEPDDRTIHWYWDAKGCSGKTTLAKHLITTRDDVLYLSGKANDMKFAIAKFLEDKSKFLRVVVMDFPRSLEAYVSWQGIEEIKNGLFFSGKYEGVMCCFECPHIICLANFEPRTEMLSSDRWHVVEIAEESVSDPTGPVPSENARTLSGVSA